MKDLDNLSAIIALLAALSVAAERLVEIIKGFVPCLNKEILDNPDQEARRKAWLQVLAVAAGLLTVWLASPILPATILPDNAGTLLVLGFLASGGSGLWNSVQTYVSKVKEVKKAEVEQTKAATEIMKKTPPPAPES